LGLDLMTPHDRLWDAVKHTLFCSREEYFAMLDGWEIIEGACGIRISKGSEFHWLPCGKLSRTAIRECIQPLIDSYGHAETRTDNERQKKFNERIGFYRIGENGDETHYRIDTITL
jgi:hypothetical protein